MSDSIATPVTCEAVVLFTVNASQIRGDELAAELEQAFVSEVDRTRAARVVVDMKAVTYVTSTGVRALLSLYQRVKALGGRVVLCGLSEMVADVLNVMRFIDTSGVRPTPFELQPDVAAAVVSLLVRPPPAA